MFLSTTMDISGTRNRILTKLGPSCFKGVTTLPNSLQRHSNNITTLCLCIFSRVHRVSWSVSPSICPSITLFLRVQLLHYCPCPIKWNRCCRVYSTPHPCVPLLPLPTRTRLMPVRVSGLVLVLSGQRPYENYIGKG